MRDVVERFLRDQSADRKLSPNTISAYRNDLTQVRDFVAKTATNGQGISDWRELNDSHIDDFVSDLKTRDYAQATVARKIAAVKSFGQWLWTNDIVDHQVGEMIVPPRVGKVPPAVASPDDIDRLVRAPLSDGASRPENLRDRAMLELLYATGMRVGELVGLDLDDVDVEQSVVRSAVGTSRERILEPGGQAMASVIDYLLNARVHLARTGEQALFVNRRGARLTRQGFWMILRQWAERVNVEGVTPHTLRHAYAVHALRNGASIREVQAALGHVSPATTSLYLDLADDKAMLATGE